MYNSDIKEEFINFYTDKENTKKNCVALFEVVARYEEKWGADICTRPTEDVIAVLDDVTGIRICTKAYRAAIIKKYLQWCVSKKIPGAINSMENIETPLGLDKLKSHTVSGPRHLQAYLDSVYSPEFQNTLDNTFRCFFWLAYGGMAEEDIFTVNTNDVDFERMIVRYRSTEVPIYREAVPAFKQCVESDAFHYERPINSKSTLVSPRITGSILIRGCRAEPNVMSFRSTLSRQSKKALESGRTELELSYFRVWLSGLFYRMHENEQLGIKPDFLPTALQISEGKTYKLDKGRNKIGARIRRLAAEYMEDYLRWKLIYKS